MSTPLPLYPGARPCVSCGWCCKSRACQFGEWDFKKQQCIMLLGDRPGEYHCKKYKEILDLPQSDWYGSPAFGAGCCSGMNPDRTEFMRKKKIK